MQNRQTARQDRAARARVRPTRKIVYKEVGEVQLELHVFEPGGDKKKEKRPAIIFFHGGVWQFGSPKQFYWQCNYLAQRGMWAASAQYRLTPSGVSVADCVADAVDAVRYVRKHADELGVDPERIAAGGGGRRVDIWRRPRRYCQRRTPRERCQAGPT